MANHPDSGMVSWTLIREQAHGLWLADGGHPGREPEYWDQARRRLPQVDALSRTTLHFANENDKGGAGLPPASGR